jgi:tripartite-type tricarboxylate transporter receptor subunit TctC
VRAPADGYSLLVFSPSAATNATMYENLSFNFIRDIAPVAGLILSFPLMLVNPKVPAKTVPEFLAFANANPGEVSFASQGIGSFGHVPGELFKMMRNLQNNGSEAATGSCRSCKTLSRSS